MDNNSAIIGAILVALCSIPFVALYLNRRKKEKKMIGSLNAFSAEHNCKIGQYDICREFIIGMDHNNEFVFFEKRTENQRFQSVVKLSDMQKVKMIRTNRSVGDASGDQSIIEKIELIFQPKLKSGKEISWLLFDAEEHMQISDELITGQKWISIIDQHLK